MSAVTTIWKISGSPVTSIDHGQGENGNILTAKEIEISHSGTYQITNCKFYLAEYSGDYSGGGASPAEDYAELLAWGAETTEDAWGGFCVNMDAVNSFPSGDWPVYNNHLDTINGEYAVFKTGQGASVDNAITLSKKMSSAMSVDGVIPASASPWPKFRARIVIPTDEDTAGVRKFDQKLRFSYTS